MMNYEINEEVEYFCGLCGGWVRSTVANVSERSVLIRHEGELFSVYEDEIPTRIRKYE